jgi:adenine phosphoribosyltransferase
MENLEKLISTYENYPKAGVSFKDVIEIVQHPSTFRELILKMAQSKILKEAEAIISIDARGFIFGSAISIQSSKPMIAARKPGKLPGELVTKKYTLEYGENSLSIQKKALKKYNSFAIIDDLLATGGTVNCVSELLNNNNKKVAGLLVVAELSKLNGKSRFNFPVESFISF